MRVNRIYFRGVKTFQCGFMFLLFLPILTGCVNLGNIDVQSTWVAQSPKIIDIKVITPCAEAKVSIAYTDAQQSQLLASCHQLTQKQGENGQYQARINLDSVLNGGSSTLGQIQITARCSQHGVQVVNHNMNASEAQNLSTPDWAKGLVWCQVFPERFRDGNPENNPNNWDLTPVGWDLPFEKAQIEEIERVWNRRLVDPRRFSYDQNRSGGAAAGVVFERRFGGDLLGVYDQLESLRDQGYTGIYLCPVFQSRSLHKYDADDHRHIDPTLGHPGMFADPGPGHTRLGANEDPSDETTWEWTVADQWFIDEFLPKAKSLGLRVVLDGVWNHVGTDHFAFSDIVEHGDASPFVDWFDVEFDDEGKLIAWKSWGSVNGNLPVFHQTEIGDLAAGPKAHIMAVTRRWMDPNGDGDPADGIDGWRLDVAGEIGKAFWKDWRVQVRELNSEALIIAEIWSDAEKMLNDQGFDGQMNYPFAFAVADWLSIGDPKGDAMICAERLNAVFHHEPEHDLVQFNLMTSHDTERLASMMQNSFVRGYDREASRWAQGTQYDAETVTPNDLDRAFAAIAVMVASPGSLMMYNGDEYAMAGADDPDNRRPIPWQTIEEDENNVYGRFNRAVNEVLKLRSEPGIGDVLRFGDAKFIGDTDGSLIVRRQLNNRRLEFLISSGLTKESEVAWPSGDGDWTALGESSRKILVEGGQHAVHVRYLVLKKMQIE